jgi:hypothetical protein
MNTYFPEAYGGPRIDYSWISDLGDTVGGAIEKQVDKNAVSNALAQATGQDGSVDYNKAFGNLLAAGRTKEAQVIANYAESQATAKYREDSLKPDSVREFEYLSGGNQPSQAAGETLAPAAPQAPIGSGVTATEEPMRLGPDGKMTYEEYLQKKKGPTAAQTAVDTAFGKDYADWNAGGGYAGVKKTQDQLNEQITRLGKSDNISGPWIGALSDFGSAGGILGGAASWGQRNFYPESIDTRQQIEESIQSNLRRVLGSQYTEKEGENLLKRTFDPGLDEGVNMRRAEQVLQQLDSMAKAKDEAAKYYEQNGTLVGWKGTLARGQGDITIQDQKNQERLPPDPDMPPSAPAPNMDRVAPASSGPTDTNVGGTVVRQGPGAAPPQPSSADKARLIAGFKRYGSDEKMKASFDKKYGYPGLADEILYELQAGR